MKRLALILLFLFLIPSAFAVEKNFTVIPNSVGIGLQKNFDIVDFPSSDDEVCVLYHIGNPSSTNATAWLVVEGELEKYFVENKPKEVFVPSGTFRYNASCCLIPIYACFKFPWVLNKTSFEGTVRGAYRTVYSGELAGTGSATGSSVAFKLTINIWPPKFIELRAGETKCINFYKVGEKCFSAPWIILKDYEEEKNVDGATLKIVYRNNLIVIIGLVGLVIVVILSVYYFLKKRHKQEKTQPAQSQQPQQQPSQPQQPSSL